MTFRPNNLRNSAFYYKPCNLWDPVGHHHSVRPIEDSFEKKYAAVKKSALNVKTLDFKMNCWKVN